MKIIIKRLGGEVESISKEYIVYVTTDTETSIKAEVCNWSELHGIVKQLKEDYPIQETIYFDI